MKTKVTGMEMEAAQDFPGISRRAEEDDRESVLRDSRPGLPVSDLDPQPQSEMSEDEKLEFIARRILREHRAAFEELAK